MKKHSHKSEHHWRPPWKVRRRQGTRARRNEQERTTEKLTEEGGFRLGCARPGNALDAASSRRMSHRRYGKPVRHGYKPFPLAVSSPSPLLLFSLSVGEFCHSFFPSLSFLPSSQHFPGLPLSATSPPPPCAAAAGSYSCDSGIKGGSRRRQSSLCHTAYGSYRLHTGWPEINGT